MCGPTHYPKRTKLLFRNSWIYKIWAKLQKPTPIPFCMDVVNVWSLGYGKYMTRLKMIPLLLDFCQSLKLLAFSFSDISVIGHSELLVLIFFFISCINTVIPLQLLTTYNDFLTTSIWHLSSRMVNHKTRETIRRMGAATKFLI